MTLYDAVRTLSRFRLRTWSRKHLWGTEVRRNSSDDRPTQTTRVFADLPKTCWAFYRLPRTMLVARRSCHPRKGMQDKGTLGRKPLAGPCPSYVNNTRIIYTYVPAKICTHENEVFTSIHAPKREILRDSYKWVGQREPLRSILLQIYPACIDYFWLWRRRSLLDWRLSAHKYVRLRTA